MKYIAAALTAMALSASAQAKVHVYEFTTTISSIRDEFRLTQEAISEGSTPGSIIAVGQQVVGKFSYDPDNAVFNPIYTDPGQLPDDTASGGYTYDVQANTTDKISFTVYDNGVPASSESRAVTALRTDHARYSWFTVDRFVVSAGEWPSPTWIVLDDRNGKWLANGEIPLQLSLGNLTHPEFWHHWYRSSDGMLMSMGGRLESLTEVGVSPVPEPGTWAMLLAGLCILGLSARRKRA